MRPNLAIALTAGLLGAAVGCSPAKVATNPPPHHTGAAVVDVCAAPPGHLALDRAVNDALVQATATQPAAAPCRPINVLAVSGGGQFGSFAAGILAGWTARGDRPDFDVVTGISSGALIAAVAYNGPKYDPLLRDLFTRLTTEELFSSRGRVRNLRVNRSLASSDPLRALLDQTIDDEFIADMKAAHACGRRLYVGTMILNTRRPVFWDLGAIAHGPNGHARVKDILLATASIPGMLPMVPITVEVDGVCYEELHADAGGVAQAFVRFGEHHPRPDPARPAAPWLAGSNFYLIAGGKLYAEILEPDLGVIPRITSTISATLFALFRADVWKLYTLCRVSGMRFHLTSIPESVPSSPTSMVFDPDLQLTLFTIAFDMMTCGNAWRFTPPGTEPGEEDFPRTAPRLSVPHPKPAPGPWESSQRKKLLAGAKY